MDKKYGNVTYSFSENKENKKYNLATEGKEKRLNAYTFSPANQSNQSVKVWPSGLSHCCVFVFFCVFVFVRISCWGWIFAMHGGFFYLIGLKSKICRFHKWSECQISTDLLSESLFLFLLKFSDILKVVLCPRNIVLPICNFLRRNFIREIIRRTIQSWNRYFIMRIPWVQNRWSTFF